MEPHVLYRNKIIFPLPAKVRWRPSFDPDCIVDDTIFAILVVMSFGFLLLFREPRLMRAAFEPHKLDIQFPNDPVKKGDSFCSRPISIPA